MTKLLGRGWRMMLHAGILVLALFVVAFAWTLKTRPQQPQFPTQNDKEALLRQIDNSVEQPLKIAGNDDCPLKIVQATVKEISGVEFTRLTRKTTDLVSVSSVPEVKLINTSEKTITGFVLAVRHPESDRNRGVVLPKASIPSGGTYEVTRNAFVSPDKLTVANADAQTHQKIVQPKMDAEKYWVQFAQRSDVFVFVSLIVFDDGSEWKAKKGGELR